MAEKTAGDYKTCPLKIESPILCGGAGGYIRNSELCTGSCCAWWDAEREKCGMLPAR